MVEFFCPQITQMDSGVVRVWIDDGFDFLPTKVTKGHEEDFV